MKKIFETKAEKDEHGNVWLVTYYYDATATRTLLYENKEIILENYLKASNNKGE